MKEDLTAFADALDIPTDQGWEAPDANWWCCPPLLVANCCGGWGTYSAEEARRLEAVGERVEGQQLATLVQARDRVLTAA